jgi:hypothetical protein
MIIIKTKVAVQPFQKLKSYNFGFGTKTRVISGDLFDNLGLISLDS